MDAQLARTLGELERKLSALERTLDAMGQPHAGAAPPSGHRSPPATQAAPPAAPGAHPAQSTAPSDPAYAEPDLHGPPPAARTRPPTTYAATPAMPPPPPLVPPPPPLVPAATPTAQTATPTAQTAAPTAQAAAPTAPAAAPAPTDVPAVAGGRLVDEAIEPATQTRSQPAAPDSTQRHAPAALSQPPGSAATQPPAPGAIPLAAPPVAQPPAPAATQAAARPTPPTALAPAPAALSQPTAEELLRFRDRLERSARELTHEYDALLGRLSYPAVSSAPGQTISFARGVPSLDIIDVEGLRDAAVRAFEADPEGVTAYGTAVGYPRLRAWIADRHGVEPERVVVTNGSLQADAFLFDQVVAGGDEVIVESPTYDRTLLGLKERGARLHAVALDAEGIDTGELARVLAAGARPTLAHVIPNFQNPAGSTLSLRRRRELVALAAEHNFLVLEDDPYADLRFSGEPQPTMLSLAPDRVVYASSFTKTVCPGVRVGYLVGPAHLIADITRRATNTYISPGMVSEALVYEFCASGALERSIHTVKTALAERARTLCAALRSDLPDAEFVAPEGGYFLWVTLPAGTDVGALFDAAAERGVAFVKGRDFMLHGGENALRLAYSGVTPAEIEQGVARLADAYRSL